MKLTHRSPLVALGFLVTGSLTVGQGDTGFLRGKGRVDAALSYTLDYYDQFWVGNDRMSPPEVGEVERETGNLWLAYGLCDEIDLVVSGSWVEAETDGTAPIPDQDDLQDLYVGAKWRFWSRGDEQGRFALLAAPSIKVPMTDYEEDDVTAIGDGQVDLRFRLIAHYQFGGFWGSVESGFDRRNGAPGDEIPVNITLGGTIADRVTIMPFYSTVDSLRGNDIGEGRFPSIEDEWSRVGVAVYARVVEHVGLTALWRTTLDGQNTGDLDSVGFGIVVSY